MPAPSQKRTKLGAKAFPRSRTNHLGIPSPTHPTTLSQYIDAEASRDPLNESRASHNKRRHNEINSSYYSDKENDSDVTSEGTPPPAKRTKNHSQSQAVNRSRSTPKNPLAAKLLPTPASSKHVRLSRTPKSVQSRRHGSISLSPPPARTALTQQTPNLLSSAATFTIRDSPPRPHARFAAVPLPTANGFRTSTTITDETQTSEASQDNGAAVFVEYQKTELEAFNELEQVARQEFCISGLDRQSIDRSIQRVFPNLSSTNIIYTCAQTKVRTNLQNWRFRTIDRARTWVNQLVLSNQGSHLLKEYDFKSLRVGINRIYDIEWLGDVFSFAQGTINFSQCSELAKLFFRYAFVIIVVHARLTHLCELHPTNPRLQKYNRRHELDSFDAISRKHEFKDKFSAADFPIFGLDNDSDFELGSDFYQDSTTPKSHDSLKNEGSNVWDDQLDEEKQEGNDERSVGSDLRMIDPQVATKKQHRGRRVTYVVLDDDDDDDDDDE